MCSASAGGVGEGGPVLVDRGAGSGLALHMNGDVDDDLLALADNDEVDVLDDLAYRVFLHILDQGELHLSLDVELKNLVRLTQDQRGLVPGEGHVLWLGAVAVDDGRNLALGADLACNALAEGVAHLGEEVVAVFRL